MLPFYITFHILISGQNSITQYGYMGYGGGSMERIVIWSWMISIIFNVLFALLSLYLYVRLYHSA